MNWVEKNSHFNDDVSAPLAEILKLYSGSFHTNLIHLACGTMELEHCILWGILHMQYVTVINSTKDFSQFII